MFSRMSRRANIRIASYLSALVLVLGASTGVSMWRAQNYKKQLELTYVRALQELSSYMTNISSTLNKEVYAGTSSQFSNLASKLWREAGAAKSSLACLPVTELELTNTYKFLSQVGEYAVGLAQNSGEELYSKEDGDNLASLLDYSRSLNDHITSLQHRIQQGEITMDDIIASGENWGKDGADKKQSDSDEEAARQPDLMGFTELEESFVGYPKLIYDGPFSDHLVDREPLMLKNLPEVPEAEAAERAAQILGVSAGALENMGEEQSNMPAYCFAYGDINVSITKRGAFLVFLQDGRAIGDKRLQSAEAIGLAKEFLVNTLGITDMEENYYETSNGICTVNFASLQGGVTCYTDLIKIGIALDTGSVVFAETRSYITNHTQRTDLTPTISAEEAQGAVSKTLTIENSRLAIIPSPGKYEQLTYEFRCQNQSGDYVLVYVDAHSGAEREILLLIETADGVLTI